jgi:hypothetical protein
MVVGADAEEPAKAHIHKNDVATNLLNQQSLDRADLIAISIENGRALDAITFNDSL